MTEQRVGFTLTLRDVLRNGLRHTRADLTRLVETLTLIVDGQQWREQDLPDLKALVERPFLHGGCGVPSATVIAYLRLAREVGEYDLPTQRAIEHFIALLENPTRRQLSRRARERSERVQRILKADDMETLTHELRLSLTRAQLTELQKRLTDEA